MIKRSSPNNRRRMFEADPIPEPSAAVGLVVFGAVAARFKRQQQAS